MLDIPLPLPCPPNEPILSYAPKTREREELKAALTAMRGEVVDVPHVVGGVESRDGAPFDVREPHAHARVRAVCHDGGEAVAERAIAAAGRAAPGWAGASFEERARVFLRAADLLAGPWRARLNAATMLGQSKTAFQAEIDAACELVDFLRFNVHFASRLAEQPISPPGVRNAVELRPLEGFVLALTPFNFTAIAGNLPAAPALLGNVVVWKPAEAQGLAAYHTMRLFEAAGLPPGVINVVYGDGAKVTRACLASPDLAGVHFTGSTAVFRAILAGVGERIGTYRSYPRVVGETGGKDFVVAHPSADASALAVALVRGAFEFQGQKCSAASRAYVPRSLWARVRDEVAAHVDAIAIGDVTDFRNFMGAVIHERSYDRLHGWLERLRADSGCRVSGKPWSKAEGYFAGPTVVEVDDPRHALFQEELFGPVLGVYVYDDARFDEVLGLVDTTSPYALTGSIFATDRAAIARAAHALRQAAGNFYVNDKPTGAVVGQQPFGGARASGTNDKAGSAYNLLRWASPRVVKETFVPPTEVGYPFMREA
ncbi:MAG: L-glutamate gamma-semialdehyde dehydrogenase [Myxococcales bacterium]|nr:L-glutamate gamma-semialdehyde dehydrogenase [Myxococcales bacterium]